MTAQPGGQQAGQCGQDRPVGPVEPGPGDLAVQDGDFVAEDQDLGVLRRLATTEQVKPAKDPDNADPKMGPQPGARQRRRSRLFGLPVMWVSGQAAWVLAAGRGPGSGSGRRQRVTSKPRAPSLPTWWAICRRVLAWRS